MVRQTVPFGVEVGPQLRPSSLNNVGPVPSFQSATENTSKSTNTNSSATSKDIGGQFHDLLRRPIADRLPRAQLWHRRMCVA